MDIQPAQLEALVAITEHGTFDAAARRLAVTPSAISQRIRSLESAAGQVLVRRGSPCTPTVAGEALVRLGRQSRLLYDEAQHALVAQPLELSIAINADTLASWFRDVVTQVSTWDGVALRLHVEDQAWSGGLLRSGSCLAAVTSEADAVQGCSVEPLGRLRYRPAASPAFADRWRRGRGHDWARMPLVVFNEKDDLQDQTLGQRGLGRPRVVHQVPASADFLEAVRLGLGWGMVPDPQLEPDLAAGRLVLLDHRQHLDVPLHWQRWRLDSEVLARVSDVVRSAAAVHLRPVRR